jgi:AraC-like DNA-binding protein
MSAVLLNPDASALGTAPALLRGTGFQYDVRDFPGPLSVKTVTRGRARWKTEDGEFWVDETSLLVVNERQPYSITVDSPSKVETCCLFFERGSVESVHRALTEAPEYLVDDPFRPPAPLHFRVRLQFADERLRPRLKAVAEAVRCGAAGSTWLEDQVLLAARDLLAIEERSTREVARVPAARPATREEIFRRVCRAREFLYASQDRAVRLEEASRAACLSPFHLHRAFRQAFGETPHDFLTRVRLERARRLLVDTQCSVTDICLSCGFESPGSFSSLFRRKFGQSPREFKRASATG